MVFSLATGEGTTLYNGTEAEIIIAQSLGVVDVDWMVAVIDRDVVDRRNA